VWSGIKSAVSKGIDGMLGLIRGIPGKVTGALGDLGGLLKNAGARLIQGLADGITSRIHAVTDAVGKVAGKIKGFFPGSPVKTGPLTSWNNGGAGRRLGDMLADGLAASQRSVASASRGLAGSVTVGALATGVGGGAPAGSTYNIYTNDPLAAAHAVESRQRMARNGRR
jgi:phage-related protein